MRNLKAFLAAPLPAAIFQSIVVALWPKDGMGVFEHPASMFVVVCLYFYVFGLLLAVPALLFLRKRYREGSKTYLLAGLIAGALPVGMALGWSVGQQWASTYVIAYNLLFFGLGGVVAGWLYWIIARRSAAQTPPKQAVS